MAEGVKGNRDVDATVVAPSVSPCAEAARDRAAYLAERPGWRAPSRPGPPMVRLVADEL